MDSSRLQPQLLGFINRLNCDPLFDDFNDIFYFERLQDLNTGFLVYRGMQVQIAFFVNSLTMSVNRSDEHFSLMGNFSLEILRLSD